MTVTGCARVGSVVARRSCYVSGVFETRATVVRNLRSRFGNKDSRALEQYNC